MVGLFYKPGDTVMLRTCFGYKPLATGRAGSLVVLRVDAIIVAHPSVRIGTSLDCPTKCRVSAARS